MRFINVYGTGENALRFIIDNNNSDNVIKNVICNDDYDKDFFCGIATIKVSQAHDCLKKYLTVIASSELAYWQIKDKLITMHNLKEFENFIYYDVYGKKWCYCTAIAIQDQSR